MELSQTVLGLILLHDAGLSATDKKLVMSEIDFKKPDDIYKKAKSGLAKYLTDSIGLSEAVEGIEIESGFLTAEMEEALVTKGWTRPPQKSGGKQSQSAGGKQNSGKKERPMNPLNEKNSHYFVFHVEVTDTC